MVRILIVVILFFVINVCAIDVMQFQYDSISNTHTVNVTAIDAIRDHGRYHTVIGSTGLLLTTVSAIAFTGIALADNKFDTKYFLTLTAQLAGITIFFVETQSGIKLAYHKQKLNN